ncbi:protein FRIGIDA [Daucus carota subsp. sativus]|nr:PREDICTED: protein FRIGIDA [Daucus carota subsp. sativus]
MTTDSTPPPPLTSDDHPSTTTSNPRPPDYATSISNLRSFATALSTFQRRYDELQQHLDFIQTTIHSQIPDPSIIPPFIPPTPPSPIAINLDKNPKLLSNSDVEPKIKIEADIRVATTIPDKKQAVVEVSESKPEIKLPDSGLEHKSDDKATDCGEKSDVGVIMDDTQSELLRLCSKTMCGRSLRRYIVTHISDGDRLREEVPKALKCAANPAKLVLECVGKFYLQGSRAFNKSSLMLAGRDASIITLECFLLMERDGVVIDNGVKEEAHNAAVAWRKRLRGEGGLYKACEADARGLLFLIGGYGIPKSFEVEDIKDLTRACKLQDISGALRRSRYLLARIPELIEQMLKYKREVEALNIVYTFDVKDKYPPQTILKSFLSKSDEILKRKRTEAADLSTLVIKDKKHLDDLKSLLRCWKNHKIDPSKTFPDLDINEKISSLEREITVLDKKVREDVANKKKEKEVESSKRSKTQDAKRPRFPGHDLPLQGAVGQSDDNNSVDKLTQMNYNGGLPEHYGYSASPSQRHESGVRDIHATRMLHEYSDVTMVQPRTDRVGLLHEYAASTRFGSGGGVVAADETEGGYISRVPYATSHLGMHSNVNPYTGQLFGRHMDALSNDRYASQTYAGKPLYSGYNDLHRPSPALEGFAGLPSYPKAGSSIRSSGSDLYHFADSVLESELKQKSGAPSGAQLRRG